MELTTSSLAVLVVLGLQPLISSAEESPCEKGLIVCERDCCQRYVQFCNMAEKRCTNCKDRNYLCGTDNEPVGCGRYCLEFLQTTTTAGTTLPAAPTRVTDSIPDPSYKVGFIATSALAVLAAIVFFVVLARLLKIKMKLQKRGKRATQIGIGTEESGDMQVHGPHATIEGRPLLGDTRMSILNEESTAISEPTARETARDGGAPTHGGSPSADRNRDARSGQAQTAAASGDDAHGSSAQHIEAIPQSLGPHDGHSRAERGRRCPSPGRHDAQGTDNASTVQPENGNHAASTIHLENGDQSAVRNHSLGFEVSGSAASSPSSSPPRPDGLAYSVKVREDENSCKTPIFNSIIPASDGNSHRILVATGTTNPASYAHLST